MENEKNLIQVDVEISLGKITSNMADIKEFALKLKDDYSNMVFNEDSISIAKEEKAKVNKFKDEVATHRKKTIAEFKKPIEEFEKLAKETENILAETYTTINNQVQTYENKIIEEKRQELIDYFNEYKNSLEIDFVGFEKLDLRVTKTASMKSHKEYIKGFLDKIKTDIQMIETQKDSAEILVDYKEHLNLGKALADVTERKRRIEEEQRKQEETKKEIIPEKEEEQYLEKPTEEELEEKHEMTFTAIGTITQLRALKEFCINNNIILKGE